MRNKIQYPEWTAARPKRPFRPRKASPHHGCDGTAMFERDPITGCWNWTGARSPNGYGRVGWMGRVALAHRATYEFIVGAVPPGLDLDHLCRNRGCINPDHLEPVTRGENARRGAATKLSEGQVAEIRRRWRSGETQTDLGREFGVHPSHLSEVVRHLARVAL